MSSAGRAPRAWVRASFCAVRCPRTGRAVEAGPFVSTAACNVQRFRRRLCVPLCRSQRRGSGKPANHSRRLVTRSKDRALSGLIRRRRVAGDGISTVGAAWPYESSKAQGLCSRSRSVASRTGSIARPKSKTPTYLSRSESGGRDGAGRTLAMAFMKFSTACRRWVGVSDSE